MNKAVCGRIGNRDSVLANRHNFGMANLEGLAIGKA